MTKATLGRGVQILLALGVPVVSSCTTCGDYQHFEFSSTPGIAVIEQRVPALTGLRDVEPFPVAYELKRDAYRMVVRTYERDSGPTVTFVVEATPKTLRIVDVPRDAEGRACVVHAGQDGGVRISWLGWGGCRQSASLGVAVMDGSGRQVGVEQFSFSVTRNGRYCVRDGL